MTYIEATIKIVKISPRHGATLRQIETLAVAIILALTSWNVVVAEPTIIVCQGEETPRSIVDWRKECDGGGGPDGRSAQCARDQLALARGRHPCWDEINACLDRVRRTNAGIIEDNRRITRCQQIARERERLDRSGNPHRVPVQASGTAARGFSAPDAGLPAGPTPSAPTQGVFEPVEPRTEPWPGFVEIEPLVGPPSGFVEVAPER